MDRYHKAAHSPVYQSCLECLGGREPVEHDDCVEMSDAESAQPPPYQSREFQQEPQLNNEHMMDELKSQMQMVS